MSETAKYISESEEDTRKIAFELAEKLRPGDVVAFTGGLGAGKTTFTRFIGEALHSRDDVSSPTFALVHCYRADVPICHFDMYRIKSFDDLYSTGFFDYLDAGNVLFIEWSENVMDYLPDGMIRIDISPVSETGREITIEGMEER